MLFGTRISFMVTQHNVAIHSVMHYRVTTEQKRISRLYCRPNLTLLRFQHNLPRGNTQLCLSVFTVFPNTYRLSIELWLHKKINAQNEFIKHALWVTKTTLQARKHNLVNTMLATLHTNTTFFLKIVVIRTHVVIIPILPCIVVLNLTCWVNIFILVIFTKA